MGQAQGTRLVPAEASLRRSTNEKGKHMHKAFKVHMLNEQGKAKATKLAEAFTALLETVEQVAGPGQSRELSVAITKLEEASFFAKKAMAQQPENHEA